MRTVFLLSYLIISFLLSMCVPSVAYADDTNYVPRIPQIGLGHSMVGVSMKSQSYFSQPVATGEWRSERFIPMSLADCRAASGSREIQGCLEGGIIIDSRVAVYVGPRAGRFEEIAKTQLAGGTISGNLWLPSAAPFKMDLGEDWALRDGFHWILVAKGDYGVLVSCSDRDAFIKYGFGSDASYDEMMLYVARNTVRNLPEKTAVKASTTLPSPSPLPSITPTVALPAPTLVAVTSPAPALVIQATPVTGMEPAAIKPSTIRTSESTIESATSSTMTTPASSDEPLPESTVLLATAASAAILGLGAVAQMLTGGGGLPSESIAPTEDPAEELPSIEAIEPEEAVAEVPIQHPETTEQGEKLLYQPPWETGGPVWMDRAEIEEIQRQQAAGQIWSDRWGWTDPQTMAGYERTAEAARQENLRHVDQNELARQDTIREQAQETTGIWTDSDEIATELWILKHAPTEQAQKDMEELVQRMTSSVDGQRIGDRKSIHQALSKMLERTERPFLTYNDQYALREEVMEKAMPFREQRDQIVDGAGTHGSIQQILSGHGLSELSEGEMKVLKGIDVANKIHDTANYFAGYTASGDSVPEAAAKTAIQVGVKSVVFSNPVIALGDTTFKYAGQAVLGRDASPSKLLEYMVNRTMDSVTGDLAQQTPVVQDWNDPAIQQVISDSQIAAIEQRLSLPDLPKPERAQLLDLLDALHRK